MAMGGWYYTGINFISGHIKMAKMDLGYGV